MKFKSLHLKAYGLFTDVRFSLSVIPGVVNVVYGLNERGKSTTRRAVRDLLYGFPHNTADDFLHDGRELRVGGDLLLPSGDEWTVYRRKGRKDTLADGAGTPVNEYPLISTLGGVERGAFERMFALDSEQLRAGGREILSGQGEAGPIIFQAGAGLIAFNRARSSFEEEAAGQFRGRSGLLVAALSRYRESLEKVRTATLSGERWAAERRELGELSVRLGDLARLRYEVDGRRASLERIRRHLPYLARRADLLDEQRAVGAVPDLPAEAREERQEAERQLDRHSVELRNLSEDLGRIEELIERLMPDLSVLEAREEISSLPERRGAAVQDREDLIRRQGESQRLHGELSEFLKEWGFEVEVEAADDLIPSRASVALIRALISEGARLREQVEMNRADVGRFRDEADEGEQALAELPIAPDVGRAAALIQDVLGRGPLEKTLSEKVQSYERERVAVDVAVRRLGLWAGSASELAAAALPSEKTIERFMEQYETLGESREELSGAIKHLQDQIVGYRGRIIRLESGGPVVTEAQVASLRGCRDHGWSLIKRGYIEAKEDVMIEAAAFNADLPLADAYEECVGEADRASDELRAQASRAAEFKTTSVEIALAEAKIEELREELGKLDDAIHKVERDWTELWRGSAIEPLSPKEMKEWCAGRNEIVERTEALDRAQDSIHSLEAEINECQRVIDSALNDLGIKSEETTTLRGAIERAQAALRAASQLGAKREKVVAAIATARRVQREKEEIVARLQRAVANWEKRWTEAVTPVECAPDANPAQVGALIDGLEEVREKLNTYQGLLRRIGGIEERISAFEQGVSELAAKAMPQFADTPPLKLAQRLIDELSAAEGIEQERTRAEEGKSQCIRRIAELNEECAGHRLTLERLCRVAGCANPKDLEAIEQRAARSRILTEELDDINRALVQDGDGLKISELLKEARDKTAEEVCGELARLSAELENLDKERQQRSESKGALENQLRSYSGSEAGALAAQQAECELASAANAAREYIRARVATAVLSRAVERFSLEHQAPILRTAADFFRRLTLDKYRSLTIEPNDDDRLDLMAVKPDGTKVSVVGLSDGARDQLYLALRIAAILDYLDRHEALPVIADDLLISFDDDRSAAALEILSELSMRTQVVVFTHHSYVVQTAQRVLGPDRVSVVELGEAAVETGRSQAA